MKGATKMKRFFSLLLPIFVIISIIGGTYLYMNSGSKTLKEEHSKYIALINEKHDFGSGLKGLETLTTEKAKTILPNIEKEIEIANELKIVDDYLTKSDINSAEDHLDKAKNIDTEKTFTQVIQWLNTEIDNYKKAVEEINKLNINSTEYDTLVKYIVEKYNFNYTKIKNKLLGKEHTDQHSSSDLDNTNKKESSKDSEKTKDVNSKKSSQSNKSSIPNTQIHPKINGQQAPETYNTLRYTQEGSVSRNIIENELKGDISNFTNEEINAAIASYNTKNQG